MAAVHLLLACVHVLTSCHGHFERNFLGTDGCMIAVVPPCRVVPHKGYWEVHARLNMKTYMLLAAGEGSDGSSSHQPPAQLRVQG